MEISIIALMRLIVQFYVHIYIHVIHHTICKVDIPPISSWQEPFLAGNKAVLQNLSGLLSFQVSLTNSSSAAIPSGEVKKHFK